MHPCDLDLTVVDLYTYGGDKGAIILGDCVLAVWTPTGRGAQEPAGYKVRSMGYGSCPLLLGEVRLPNRLQVPIGAMPFVKMSLHCSTR